MRCIHAVVLWSRIPRSALLIAAILCLAAPAVADFQNVGKIVIDKRVLAGGGTKGPGMDILAHWELADSFKTQSVFEESKLRWLQTLWVSGPVAGLTPSPNRLFVDPRKGQLAPGHPDGAGDDLPFYDFSYPSLEDAKKNDKNKIDGSGPFLRDDPRAQLNQKSIRFDFMTLVVGIQDDMRLTALGGFTWGFEVDADDNHTLLPLKMLSADVIGLGRFNDLNGGLSEDFFTWRMPTQKSFSADTQYFLGLSGVPEPATLCQFMIGIVFVAFYMRQRLKPSARTR